MRRGEIWRYQPAVARPGQALLRLIVSAEAINANPAVPVLLAVHLVDTDPGGLLAVRVDPHGWATALTIEPVLRSRLAEHIDTADHDVLEALSTALRAAQEL